MAREKDMIRAIGILGLLALAAGGAYGGSLSLSWAPNQDEATAGYELEVVDAAGHVLNVYDVRSATHFTVPGLADGEVRHFRVRPYDRWGHRAATPSADIATMPAPRIDSLEGWTPVNGAFRVAVVGANFAPDARLVARWSGLTVLSATAQSSTRIVAEISVAPEAGSPLPEDFLVVNSVRRSDTFLAAHPRFWTSINPGWWTAPTWPSSPPASAREWGTRGARWPRRWISMATAWSTVKTSPFSARSSRRTLTEST